MSRPLCSILLTLSAVFPSAVLALGLGDLHVESALGQDFVARIDLIDVSADDLARLQAAIADDDAFQRYRVERPGFLLGTTVAVGQDDNGQPILRLRSTQAFTEPVATFLVDVHWRGGELIREYSAFLDPAGLAPNGPGAVQATHAATPTATSAPVMQPPYAMAPTATSAPVRQPPHATAPTAASAFAVPPTSATAPTPMASSSAVQPTPAATAPRRRPQLRSYTVSRGDTLAHIASIAGARSGKERHRMMIAIYRANPAAFQANLNALHSRVVLRIPSAEELAAISLADAEHEYKDQLAAWRASDRRRLRASADVPRVQHTPIDKHTRRAAKASLAMVPAPPTVSGPAVDSKPDIGSPVAEADRLVLTHRVESLEQSLQAVRRELQERTQEMQVRAAFPPAPPATIATDMEPSQNGARPWYGRSSFMALVSGIAMLLAAGLWWASRRRDEDDLSRVQQAVPSSSLAVGEPKTAVPPRIPSAELPIREPAARAASRSSDGIHLQEDAQVVSPLPDSAATAPPAEVAEPIDTGATTAILGPEIEGAGDTVEHKFSFYNPESHADTTHVVMGSELTQPLAFVERRKNPAIVLQQAIEREPSRSDLHVKLLELYYAMASENRLAFLEAARQIMQKKGLLSDEDWARITDMGRRIAPEDELFANDVDDQAVA